MSTQSKQKGFMFSQEKQKKEKIERLRQQIVDLTKSPLYQYRQKHDYQPVIGEGSLEAKIMFIGEAPGKNEAETGRPFCGAAGRVLNELLSSVGLDREQVYITNIVNDRPPNNRDPKPAEIKLYSPFLIKLIEIIQPQILASLGRFSMKFLMKQYGLKDQLNQISQLHGQIFEIETGYGQAELMPLYHPAVGLYQATKRPVMEQDFQRLAEVADLS